jgi:hypothetical protein
MRDVNDQILALSGRRYLSGHAYRRVQVSGATSDLAHVRGVLASDYQGADSCRHVLREIDRVERGELQTGVGSGNVWTTTFTLDGVQIDHHTVPWWVEQPEGRISLAEFKAALKTYVLSLTLVLSACTSVGVQYVPPTEPEAAAEFKGGPGVHVVSFDSKGCYSGRTHVDGSIRLHANQAVIVSDERKFYQRQDPAQAHFCRNQISFVPGKDGIYQFRSEVREREIDKKTLFGNPVAISYCTSIIEKIDADGTIKEIPSTAVAMRQRALACIKAEPLGSRVVAPRE